MRKVLPLLSVVLIMGATAATVSAQGKDWVGVPPHGHVMLLGAEIEENTLSFDRCVEFAAGAALRVAAHHESVHTGNASGSPFVMGALWDAGHIVVPLAPFPFVPADWTGCESFESGMALPG